MANNQVIDRLLVARAQEGDKKAFELLVRRWHPKILGFSYRLTRDADAARDVSQESWVAAVKGLKRLDDPALFRAWIFRIAKNKAADYIRGRQKTRKQIEAMEQMAVIENETRKPGPEEGLTLKALIDNLPQEKRALLILFYVEGLSLAELADVFETPAGTIKSRLFTAREELKSNYKETGK